MSRALVLIPALPLVASAVLIIGGYRLRRIAGPLACVAIAASFVVSLIACALLLSDSAKHLTQRLYEWVGVGGLHIDATLRVDSLTVVMLLVITGVGSLIHIYSVGYMADDPRRATYFGYLNLFAASMLILVMGANFVMLFVGWELVGACSYLLIAFWFDRPSAAAAGKKAFIVNRVGDFAFLTAIMLVFATVGTLDFETVSRLAPGTMTSSTAIAVALLLLAGAAGKSAQVPLHVWLPDAMEGPTPVSALIHAATMVTAGVYMVARTHVVFELAPGAGVVVALMGVSTALLAGVIAIAQDDLKRVLAYSTISQLGLMFLGVGAGILTGSGAAYAAGISHLATHAFFKALLFLGAGSVMHALGGETNLKRMGGLRAALPITSATFFVGWLAISGIFPLAGFFTKDAILGAVFEAGQLWAWFAGLLVAGLTAFYMSRLVFLAFFGPPRGAQDLHPHESPPVMTVPLVVLAGLSVLGGLLEISLNGGAMTKFLEPVFAGGVEKHAQLPFEVSELALAAVALGVALAGIALAHRLYLAPGAEVRRAHVKQGMAPLVNLAGRGFGIDDIYGRVVVLPAKAAAAFLTWVLDARYIDGAVNGVANVIGRSGEAARKTQSGLVRRYAAAVLAGVIGVLSLFVARIVA